MSVSAISRCAKDEGWAAIRAEYLEQKLREAGASEIILSSLKNESGLIKECREIATDYVRVGKVLLEEIENDKEAKISTRTTAYNTLGFGLANVSRLIDSVGLVGMPRELRNAKNNGGTQDGQPWEKGMLQQINVTVQNIGEAAKKAEQAAKAETKAATVETE
jgi:hypothetical protein